MALTRFQLASNNWDDEITGRCFHWRSLAIILSLALEVCPWQKRRWLLHWLWDWLASSLLSCYCSAATWPREDWPIIARCIMATIITWALWAGEFMMGVLNGVASVIVFTFTIQRCPAPCSHSLCEAYTPLLTQLINSSVQREWFIGSCTALVFTGSDSL